MYKLIYNVLSGQITTVRRFSDNAVIPFDTDNTDYQEYLQWIAEGNTPEEAE